MTYKQWCMENLNYETLTTYFMDFSIAERFGEKAIKDTFRTAMLNKEYKTMTELCLVLNHKIWFTYEKNPQLAEIYDKLWRQCDQWCMENLKGEELEYFYRTTD